LFVAAITRTSTFCVSLPPTRERSLLEKTEELDLRTLRNLADLVKEECATIGLLESPFAARDRARERAALVAEERALEE
jgi:hypothetical protein